MAALDLILIVAGVYAIHRVVDALREIARYREEERFRRLHPGRKGVWK